MVTQKIVSVVIDTNVVVSALLFGGLPGRLIPLWQSGQITPVASKEIISEYIRVLTYPKFNLTEDEIQYLLYTKLLPYFDVVSVGPRKEIIVRQDPADDKFILCALAAKTKVIISGDMHLLALNTYNNIEIVSPSQFLAGMSHDL